MTCEVRCQENADATGNPRFATVLAISDGLISTYRKLASLCQLLMAWYTHLITYSAFIHLNESLASSNSQRSRQKQGLGK